MKNQTLPERNTVRLTVQLTKTVEMSDSDGWVPQLSFIKASRINDNQAHAIASVCNTVEKFRSVRLANTTHVQWIIGVTDSSDAERILGRFNLDEYAHVPTMFEGALTITLQRL